MSFFAKLLGLKNLLRRLFLRGPLLAWWVARRGRQLDHAYAAELTRTLSGPAPQSSGNVTTAAPLRRLLFIADCMWELNDLVPELRNICDVSVLDLRPKLKSAPPSRPLSEVVLSAVEDLAARNGPEADLVFFYARPMLLSDAVFDLLRKCWHAPLLGMNLDDKIQFFPYGILSSGDENYQRWAHKFDLNITNSLAATDWYRQQGVPCLYSPQGVHQTPDLSMPASAEYQRTISFLGSIKPERKFIVDQILAAGIPIQLFGSGWPSTEWVDNPNTVYRNTQINLGIGFASPSLTLTTVKGRDFECPGVGACYLTTYNWELAEHYELGKEILCYRSAEELLEIYSFYRKRPAECLKIAQAAWRRCTDEHTWEKRFRRVFREMGFRLA